MMGSQAHRKRVVSSLFVSSERFLCALYSLGLELKKLVTTNTLGVWWEEAPRQKGYWWKISTWEDT
jgi:hypothetical protein